jgi:hypothetical protein
VQITTRVQLGEDDSFAYTADAAATQVLAALGGNPTKDYSTVTVLMPATAGTAGTPPPEPSVP